MAADVADKGLAPVPIPATGTRAAAGGGGRPVASHSRLSVADVTSRAMMLQSARKQLSSTQASSSSS